MKTRKRWAALGMLAVFLLSALFPAAAFTAWAAEDGYQFNVDEPTGNGLLFLWLFPGEAMEEDHVLNFDKVPAGKIDRLHIAASSLQDELASCAFMINGELYNQSVVLDGTDFFDGTVEIVIGEEQAEAWEDSYYKDREEKMEGLSEDTSYGEARIVGRVNFKDGKFLQDVSVGAQYYTAERAQEMQEMNLNPIVPAGKYSAKDLSPIMQGIIDWKKAANGSTPDGPLMNDTYLEQAGTSAGDWYQIGLSRFGVEDNYEGYLAVIKDYVEDKYKEPDKLHPVKTTEWHRISLAILACGGDPTNFGTDEEGTPINLIADGTYNRGHTNSLGAQGINGWTWGLITLDSMRYQTPDDAYYSRTDIIDEILALQLEDGGFVLNPTPNAAADPDVTAMTVQALAPYYNNSNLNVKGRVDEALECLSRLQQEDGGFESWGSKNVESAAQVLVALCSVGVDPQNDPRFVKNGNSVIDSILSFRQEDGGFTHSYDADSANPSALPGQSNSMASEQALYALAAAWRQMQGMSTLYDFRSGSIAAALVDPEDSLAGAVPLKDFTEEDRQAVEALPEPLTTGEYVTVVTLLEKLEQCKDFDGYDTYKERLESAKAEIDLLKLEIENINKQINEKLYPFESLTLSNKAEVDAIAARYEGLPDGDKAQISYWEDVVKSKTHLDNMQRAVYIGVILAVVAVVAAAIVWRRIRERGTKKGRDMEELARQYEGENL